MFNIIHSLHIIGASIFLYVIIVSLVNLHKRDLKQTKETALNLALITIFQLVSDFVLVIINNQANSYSSVCAKTGLYILTSAVAEILLYCKLKNIKLLNLFFKDYFNI